MILAADNLRITNSIIERAVDTMDPAPVREMTKKLDAAGAGAIDINPGPLFSRPCEKMEFLVRSVQEVTDLPIILDTTNPVALKAGLETSKNKVIINGVSLEHEKLEKILPLASEFDTDIIGYLLNSDGHPPFDTQHRISVAVELYQRCSEAGVSENRLIIDPVVAPLLWNDGSNRNRGLLELIRLLPDVLGFKVKTVAGLSNLTSGIKNKDIKTILQKAYIPMLYSSGLSMILMNILDRQLVQLAKTCNQLLSEKPFSELEILYSS